MVGIINYSSIAMRVTRDNGIEIRILAKYKYYNVIHTYRTHTRLQLTATKVLYLSPSYKL